MSVPTLICTAGGLDGQRFEVTAQGLRIGREPSCEVHLQDPDVSRSHARVLVHNGAVWVQDAGSRNGVFVNDARVVEHKQLKEGDQLVIGIHRFTLEVAQTAPAPEPGEDPEVSVDLSALAEPKKKWKIWPFAVAAVLVIGCIGGIGALGGGPAGPDVDEPGGYSLASALGEEDAPEEGAGTDLAEAMALSAEGPDVSDQWPDPPEGATSAELVERGHGHYQAGRLREALEHYHMALKVDPECEICDRRIERVSGELNAQVARYFDEGKRYYDSLRYREALGSWERVLTLEPNTEAPIHKQTVEYMNQARAKLGEGN